MTIPPSRWRDSALSLALNLLVIALALYVAAKLVVAVLPVLIGLGIAGLIGFVGWSAFQYWRSRW
jgi:hypothetical protein